MAGTIQLVLDSLPKMNDCAAKWLSEEVVASPMVMKVVETDPQTARPLIVEPIPPEKSSLSFCEKEQRDKNYRKWSQKYP